MSKTATKPRNAPPPAARPAVSSPRWDSLLFAGFLAWTFVSLVYPLRDTDFWWHLKTGELILAGHKPPQVDWYTFTDFDQPWIDLHWGFQVLITLLYRLGGVNLVILTKAVVITAAVGVAWQAAGRSLPAGIKATLWVLPVMAVSGRGYERPEMLSQLFLAAWLFVAFRVEERPRLIWLLPAMQLVWANCHALFVLGLVVGGCYVADYVARQFAHGRFGLEPAPRQPGARSLIRAGGLVALACFATPYFAEGALFPLTLYRKFTVDQAFYSVNIGEFQQPIRFVVKQGLTNIYVIAELGVWIMTAASFVWAFAQGRRWSLLRLMLFAAYSHLAWEASRNTNIFSLVSGVVLCANLGDALAARKSPIPERARLRFALARIFHPLLGFLRAFADVWAAGLRPRRAYGPEGFRTRAGYAGLKQNRQAVLPLARIHRRLRLPDASPNTLWLRWRARYEISGLGVGLCLTCLIALVVTGQWNRWGEGNKPFGLGEAKDWFIHDAAEFAGQPGFPDRAFISSNGQASVYSYHNHPRGRVFMDGRLEVCTLDTFRLFNRIITFMIASDPSWQGIFDPSGANLPVVILDTHMGLLPLIGMLHTPGWRMVYADPAAGVFLDNRTADRLKLERVDRSALKLPPKIEAALREFEAAPTHRGGEERGERREGGRRGEATPVRGAGSVDFEQHVDQAVPGGLENEGHRLALAQGIDGVQPAGDAGVGMGKATLVQDAAGGVLEDGIVGLTGPIDPTA